jgi:hypothetical protein
VKTIFGKTRVALVSVMAMVWLGEPASAQMSYNRWKIDVSPYFWLSAAHGDLTARGTTETVDLGIGEVADLTSWGISAHVEARKRVWALILDGHYRALDEKAESQSTTLKTVLVEASAGYAVIEWLEVIGGLRYFNARAGVRDTPETAEKSWVDPLVGARATWKPKEAWTLSGRADIGGFGVGSDFSWNVTAAAAYRVYDFSFIFGYRAWGADYETGSGADLFQYDVITHGPGVGMTFHFGGEPDYEESLE